MSLIDRLDDLIRGDDDEISDMAKMAVRAQRLRDAGSIDERQFDDLVLSIKRMYEIEARASSIIRQKKLKDAIDTIYKFLSLGSSFI